MAHQGEVPGNVVPQHQEPLVHQGAGQEQGRHENQVPQAVGKAPQGDAGQLIGDPQEHGEAEEEPQEDEHPPAAGVDLALGLQFDQVQGRDALAFPHQHLAPLHLEVDGL